MTQEVDPHTLPVPQFQMIFHKLNVDALDPQFVPENK